MRLVVMMYVRFLRCLRAGPMSAVGIEGSGCRRGVPCIGGTASWMPMWVKLAREMAHLSAA
jgi:hypothetical protein